MEKDLMLFDYLISDVRMTEVIDGYRQTEDLTNNQAKLVTFSHVSFIGSGKEGMISMREINYLKSLQSMMPTDDIARMLNYAHSYAVINCEL